MDEKLFEGDPITLRETPITKLTSDKDYYKDKMVQYRNLWKSIDIGSVSMYLPKKHAEYFRTIAKLLSYEVAINEVEKRDPDLLDMFANKQIRLTHSRADLFAKVAQYKDYEDGDKKGEKMYEQAKSILGLFDSMRSAHTEAIETKKINDVDNHFYWLAREYALSLYIRAASDLFELREKHDDLPENIEI